jgi:hypothetical protein
MRFYIFASDERHIVANIKDAIKSGEDYYEIREYYDHINSEYRFNHSYLIADFGTFKPAGMFGKNTTATLSDLRTNDELPYFIVAEFHYNPEDNSCNAIDENGKMNLNNAIRKDMVTITSNGFARIFYNNEAALNSFLYYLDNKIPAQMTIKMKYLVDTRVVILERFIASSVNVLRNNKSYIEKIVIDANPYSIIKPKREFYNFVIEDDKNTETIAAKVTV